MLYIWIYINWQAKSLLASVRAPATRPWFTNAASNSMDTMIDPTVPLQVCPQLSQYMLVLWRVALFSESLLTILQDWQIALKALHYSFPALVFFYFVFAITITVCTLQTRSLRVKDQHVRRDVIFALIIVLIGNYVSVDPYMILFRVPMGLIPAQYSSSYSMLTIWTVHRNHHHTCKDVRWEGVAPWRRSCCKF